MLLVLRYPFPVFLLSPQYGHLNGRPMRSPHETFKRPNHIKVWRPRQVVYSTGKPLS